MRTRTKNALVVAILFVAMGAGLAWMYRHKRLPEPRAVTLEAIPTGALVVAVVDLARLRASPLAESILGKRREIPGLGKVGDVCGFDPIDRIDEIAIAIPAAGDEGEFGLVGSGSLDGEALIACASKVIAARGGKADVSPVGSFRIIRDTTLGTAGGEIAVRSKGLVLLGGGAYLRAMIDAADGRTPTIRSSRAHTALGRDLEGGDVRVTIVLSPQQQKTLADELERDGTPPSARALVGAALGVRMSTMIHLHGMLACNDAASCNELAPILRRVRDERAADYAIRLVGFGSVLERMDIVAEGDRIHARLDLPPEEATMLFDRLTNLRGLRHPMPGGERRRDPLPGDPPGRAEPTSERSGHSKPNDTGQVPSSGDETRSSEPSEAAEHRKGDPTKGKSPSVPHDARDQP